MRLAATAAAGLQACVCSRPLDLLRDAHRQIINQTTAPSARYTGWTRRAL